MPLTKRVIAFVEQFCEYITQSCVFSERLNPCKLQMQARFLPFDNIFVEIFTLSKSKARGLLTIHVCAQVYRCIKSSNPREKECTGVFSCCFTP